MVSFARGWDPLRREDFGVLCEHLVLEHLQAHIPRTAVLYWRDEAQRELDFVLAHRRNAVHVVECKCDLSAFDGAAHSVVGHWRV